VALPPWYRWFDSPRNTLLPHLCYHTKFHRSRSNRLGVFKVRVPRCWDAGAQSPWDGDAADPKKRAPPHVCYHDKFGRWSNRMCAVRVQNIWETLVRCPVVMGIWLNPRNTPLPTCVSMPILLVPGQRRRSAWEALTYRVLLFSFNDTQNHWNQHCYLWLSINVPWRPWVNLEQFPK